MDVPDGVHKRAKMSPQEIAALRDLAALVDDHDGLQYRLNEATLRERPGTRVSDLLYVQGGRLVGYLGLFQFDPDVVEVNGLVHPAWRRRGIFTTVWGAARDQIRLRQAKVAHFICQRGAEAGQAMMAKLGAEHTRTEFKMAWDGVARPGPISELSLRLTGREDIPELAAQNALYFGGDAAGHEMALREATPTPEGSPEGRWTYLAQAGGMVVGKVDVSIYDNNAWIYGLGIRPECRGRGLGRALLAVTLALLAKRNPQRVLLEVEADNERALGLYTASGLQMVAAYDYYELAMDRW